MPAGLLLGWVTVYRQVNCLNLTSHEGQLSLPSIQVGK